MSRRWISWCCLALAACSAAAGRGFALDWTEGTGFRSAALPTPIGTGQPGFTRLPAAETGIAFTNFIARSRYLTNQIPLNGSGVCAGDIDGDGLPDAFFAGLGGGSELFRNQGGWRFGNFTDTAFSGSFAQLLREVDATGCAFADLDGDGDLDLVLNTIGRGTHVLFNDGRGRFEPKAVLNAGRCGSSLAIADLDGDGDLDLYVANYRTATIRDDPGATYRITQDGDRQRVAAYNGRSTSEPDLVGRFSFTPSGVRENGEPDVLFLNDGRGALTPVVWSDGTFIDEDGRTLTAPPYDWGLSVVARDFTGDGLPDLYVCNDFQSPDRFWSNETKAGGPLRMRAASMRALRCTSAFSMGIDVADVNRDGIWDFFVADMRSRSHALRNVQIDNLPPNVSQPGMVQERTQFSHNTLQLGRGDGTFAEIGRLAGLSASEWSWTPAFIDVDLDGYEDLLVSNGHEMDMMDADASARAEALKAQRKLSRQEMLELRGLFRRGNSPNAAFRNRTATTSTSAGDRVPRFEDASVAWGFADAEVSNGLCLADLDGDGDADVLVNNLNGAAGIYRNNGSAPRVAIRLKGSGRNTHGIGARIRLVPATGDGFVTQTQECVAGGRYLGSDDPERTLAAPKAVNGWQLDVTWRSGAVTTLTNIQAGRIYEVAEHVASKPTPPAPSPLPWFADVSAVLNHHHVEAPFNDRERQPLLPRLLSDLGPGVTWSDVDNDGRDELLVGAGRGGTLAIIRNASTAGKPAFQLLTNAALARSLGRDLTSLHVNSGIVIAGSANYEDGATNAGLVRLFLVEQARTGESALGYSFSAGPIAVADVDGDGTLEQFVGGRVRSGRYPEPVPSILFRIKGGRYTVAQEFNDTGLVSGACFTDFDGDGDPDLALACEWGPVRLFRNDGGKFTEVTQSMGLAGMNGWWNSVAAGDFDEDGRMDIVAGNWGWNDFFNQGAPFSPPASGSATRSIAFADFENRGAPDLVEGYVDRADGVERPTRYLTSLGGSLPSVREKFATLMEYGQATLPVVLSAAQATGNPAARTNIHRLTAGWFATTLFLNRGDHFEPRTLPLQAQVSPVFGLVVADLDGDGHEDLFLTQNSYPVHPEEARQDAGRGVLLAGDGKGGFRTIPGQESGLIVPGEGRGAAAGDFDGDGRVDLVAAQNGNETKLFHNERARPGLRVRLHGPELNAAGYGASVRLKSGEHSGPWHEIHGGAGYWSVDSAVAVLARGDGESVLEVRWPGGKAQSHAVPAAATEVQVEPDGKLTILRSK